MFAIKKSDVDRRNDGLLKHHQSLGSPRCQVIQMTTYTTDDQAAQMTWRSVLQDGKVDHTFTIKSDLADVSIMIVDDTKDRLLQNAQRAPKVGKNAKRNRVSRK